MSDELLEQYRAKAYDNDWTTDELIDALKEEVHYKDVTDGFGEYAD